MRRNAGSFVREKMVRLSMLGRAGVGILIGLAIGLFYSALGEWIGYHWGLAAYIATGAAVYFAVRILDRPSFRWNMDNLEKDVAAETRVGQILEYAITAENCAVAHSVTMIARVGDIDHIVATPVSVWVIETKYRRVSKKSFSKVLSRIAANTDAVRQWVPAGTPVRGCLVLAYETEIKRRDYSYLDEKITAYTPDLLMREMRCEARGKRSLDERITKDIWKLGATRASRRGVDFMLHWGRFRLGLAPPTRAFPSTGRHRGVA